MNSERITIQEVKRAINKFKQKKAPGPDEMSVELFKQLNDANKAVIVDILNDWLEEKHNSLLDVLYV